MQCVNLHDDIIPRALFYQSVILTNNTIKSGVEYNKIPNSIAIWLVNDIVTNRNGYMQEMVPMFKANYKKLIPKDDEKVDPIEIANETQRVFIIELKKINDNQKQYISEGLKEWIKFIKDPSKIKEDELKNNESMSEAMKYLEYLSHDDETRSDYNSRQCK